MTKSGILLGQLELTAVYFQVCLFVAIGKEQLKAPSLVKITIWHLQVYLQLCSADAEHFQDLGFLECPAEVGAEVRGILDTLLDLDRKSWK